MKRRTFVQVASLATGSLLFPAFLARVARGEVAGTLTFRLQVASAADFAPRSLMLDQRGLAEPRFAVQGLDAGQTYFWRANATAGSITSEWSEVHHFSTASTVGTEPSEQPYTFGLGVNYPNPFNPATTIPFTLAEPGPVTLRVFNELGQEVARLVDDYRAAGAHEAVWDAGGLPSGTYFCVLRAGSKAQTRPLVLVK